jgi:hypothetical protein
MKNDKPIKIIEHHERGHWTQTRIFARNIHESFCMQRGCRFYKQHAQQGVCHTTKTFTGSPDWSYVDAIDKEASLHVGFIRKQYRKDPRKKYISRLENEITTMWMSSMFHTDEMVYLRRELAVTRKKLEAMTKKMKKA